MPTDPPTNDPSRTDALERRVRAQDGEIAELKAQIKKLQAALEEALRAGKRQAAPFSKGPAKPDPKKPGRKPGDDYGRYFSRARPERIDAGEDYDVPLPADGRCPHCGADGLCEEEVVEQFQTELPRPRPIHRRFRIHVGRCKKCRKRVQPRHPLQANDAIGAAAVQIGPEAHGLAALLKTHGMTGGNLKKFFKAAFGLDLQRTALVRSQARTAEKLRPTYRALVAALPAAPVVNADETGWKIGGLPAWAWAFVAARFTVYRLVKSRGSDVLEETIGLDFAGLLGRDGYAPYRRLLRAIAQSCLAHLFVRSRELIETALRGAARFPHEVIRVLKAALDLRDRREELTAHGFTVARGRIEARMDRLIEWRPTYAPNETFRRHLERERPALFTFLHHPEIEATNWKGEHAMRPLTVIRKNCGGGNRTPRGARTSETLLSIVRTCEQQAKNALALFISALRAPIDTVFPLLPEPSG